VSKCVKCGNEILTGDIHWEMGLCNNCYNELYKDHKTHISLDKMWLELAQSFRDENEKLQDKVADLEAKLAESEEKKESYRLQNEQHHLQLLQFYSRLGVEAFGADIHEKALETLMIMKEQLAEKTLTIEQINKAFIENRSLWKGKYERANQDKISFAVEQLEQLKKLCQEKFNWWENSEWEGDIYDKSDVSNAYFDIEANVDNQIEELKKEMK